MAFQKLHRTDIIKTAEYTRCCKYNIAAIYSPTPTVLIHGTNILQLEWNDIVWAAMSVGKVGLDDMIWPMASSLYMKCFFDPI